MSGSRPNRAASAPAAAVRSAHADRTLSVDRAATLAARALDDAMHAVRATNEAVGAALGCGESVVRGMRTGQRAITASRILRLPTALRVEYLARLDATAATPAPRPRREVSALLVVGRAAELTTALAQALDDGEISDAELDALRPMIGRLDRVLNPLRAAGDA